MPSDAEYDRLRRARRATYLTMGPFTVFVLVALLIEAGIVTVIIVLALAIVLVYLVPALVLTLSDRSLDRRAKLSGSTMWPARLRGADYNRLAGAPRGRTGSPNAYLPGVLAMSAGVWSWQPSKRCYELGYRELPLAGRAPRARRMSGIWRQTFVSFMDENGGSASFLARQPFVSGVASIDTNIAH